jgi:porin
MKLPGIILETRNLTRSAALLLSMAVGGTALASEPAPTYGDRLTGGWNGARAAMAERGYNWDIVYKLDLVGKANGANSGKLYWLDNLDVMLSADGGKFGWSGFSALLHILSNQGQKPALEGGRLPNGLDNIETPEGANTTKIYQAWVQQSFGDSGFSVLAGLYDLNSEFYLTDASAMFIHPTFGIGNELAGTGVNGPSIFPTTSLGIRFKYEPKAKGYFQAAVLDGVPGDPDNPHGTHIQFAKGDGTLTVTELGYHLGTGETPEGKVALGMWRYSAKFDDLLDVDTAGNPVRRHSYGMYVLGEHTLWRSGERDLRGFVRAGQDDGDTTQFVRAWSAGLVWRGIIAGRADDMIGIGIFQEDNARKYRIASGNPAPYERGLEIDYRRQVTPWLVVQPFAQHVINHGSTPTEDRTWWTGVRFEMNI